jgi:predicted MFS family arabinose efflux permease
MRLVSGRRPACRSELSSASRVGVILVIVFAWMLAHNIVYTYIASYLRAAGVDLPIDLALVVFGMAALIGIWITGVVIDRALRGLVLTSIVLFIAAGGIFLLGHQSLVAVLLALALWGIAFGGAATQLQTAMGEARGSNGDVANALLTVSFNLAIFAGGVTGAVLIDSHDGLVLPGVMIALALAALVVVLTARRSAFPVGR